MEEDFRDKALAHRPRTRRLEGLCGMHSWEEAGVKGGKQVYDR